MLCGSENKLSLALSSLSLEGSKSEALGSGGFGDVDKVTILDRGVSKTVSKFVD